MKPFSIPSPCHESWDQMRNDGASRFCFSCDKSVFDLSKMTEREIAGLTLVSGGRFCGRQVVRKGELVVAPPVPVTRRAAWPIRAAVIASALGAAACDPAAAQPPYPTDPVVTQPVGTEPDRGAPAEPGDPSTSPPKLPPEVTIEVSPGVVMAGMIAYTPTLPTALEFAPGKSSLGPEGRAQLGTAAEFLRRHAPAKVLIEGHANPKEAKRPERLARARGEAVKKALIGLGIPRERLILAEPVLSNGDGAETRAVTMHLDEPGL